MGVCSSTNSQSGFSTAKLILQDGQLQEFSTPVKVSHLLHKNPSTFICNADNMDFDDVVSAVDSNEFLQLGCLYFMLPLNKLKRPLTAMDMAALAMKANLALGNGKGLMVVESDFNEVKTGREVGGDWTKKKVVSGGRRRRSTALVLSVIPE